MRPAVLLAVAVLLLASLLALAPRATAQDEPVVLHVGDQAQMRTRNVLRVAIGSSGDEDWGIGILRPVYSNLALFDPITGELLPYIAKGVDADGDGVFDRSESGRFGKDPSTNQTDVTIYFDFNGVRWHDGVPMTVMDVMFTLHLASLDPRYNSDLRVLWDDAGSPSSNFTWARWLAVEIAPKVWEGEASLPGDPNLRSGIRFRLQAPFARFYDSVLGEMPVFPRHLWEITGGGRHADFGRLIYPEGHPRAGNGIPVNETRYTPFDYAAAEAWEPADADVVGSGPFRFVSLILGISTRLERNAAYYTGVDPSDPAVVFDPALAASLHPPYVDAIVFKVYRTTQLGILALKRGEIEYYRWSIPSEFIPDLLNDPAIRVWANSEPGSTYLAYNMRRAWLGYGGTGLGDAYDTGRPFRLAAGHAIDKRQCVLLCLYGYGAEGNGVVSPSNTFWYNDTVPVTRYDLDAARAILDAAHNESLARGENWWGDADGDGWRELPGRGDAGLRILIPQADYDPRRASAGVMFAEGMRRVGLNVTSVPTAFGALAQAIEARDFDMLILEWRLSWDPDYLFALFHSSGRAGGLNYPGYADAVFDHVIEASRRAMDRDERQHLIKWAQGIVMEDRPVEPLYFKTALQATRQDRFANWTVNTGTLWNYWSWIGVRPLAQLRDLVVTVQYQTAMAAGGRQSIEASVRDAAGRAMAGATVTMRILATGGGRFIESDDATVSGTTGDAGTFTATYEAPPLAEGYRDIFIEAEADHPVARESTRRTFAVTVFPPAVHFLTLRVSLPAGDLTFPDAALPVRIEVRDETGYPVADARVRGTVAPANATLSRDNGTAQEMASVFLSPPSNLQSNVSYRVSLTAETPGFYPAYANFSILVLYLPEGSTRPSGGVWDNLVLAAVVGAIAVVAGVAVLAWIGWRRRPSRKA